MARIDDPRSVASPSTPDQVRWLAAVRAQRHPLTAPLVPTPTASDGRERLARVVLMRHGDADWPLVNGRRLRGGANDLVPLTPGGVAQIEQQADLLAVHDFQYVVSSPMTRALQSASIAAQRLGVQLRVEFDLHEWVPDLTYLWTEPCQVDRALDAMRAGVAPEEFNGPPFERESDLRARVKAALRRHAATRPVLVVTHGVVIWSVTGRRIETAEHVWWGSDAPEG